MIHFRRCIMCIYIQICIFVDLKSFLVSWLRICVPRNGVRLVILLLNIFKRSNVVNIK